MDGIFLTAETGEFIYPVRTETTHFFLQFLKHILKHFRNHRMVSLIVWFPAKTKVLDCFYAWTPLAVGGSLQTPSQNNVFKCIQ